MLRDNCFSGRPARNPANQRGYRIFRNGSKTRNFFLSRGLRTQSRAGFNRGSATFPKEPRVRYNGPEKNTETQMVSSRFPAGGGLPQDMLYVPWNSSPPGFPHPPPPRVRFLAWNSSPPGLRHPPPSEKERFLAWNSSPPGFPHPPLLPEGEISRLEFFPTWVPAPPPPALQHILREGCARPETLQTRGVIAFSGMVPRPATFSYLGGLELISTPKRAPGKIHFAGKHPKPLINYGVRKVLRNACFCGCPAGKSWKPTGFIAVSGWGRRFC